MIGSALVVSIHDVSPMTREAVAAILAGLAELGIGRTSLLVVPDHHHRGNINADPEFGAWLRDMITAGHEAVLHGYYHQRARRARESTRTRFFTRIYTADEGEFYDIAYNEARALLTRGRDDLERCAGVMPMGFIAPAWLLSPGGEAAAGVEGFGYTTRLKTVVNLREGETIASQSLCWSVRSGARRAMSLAWNQLLFQALQTNPLLRISIHPPDIFHAAIWRQIEQLAARARGTRIPLTYCEFMKSGASES